MGQTLDILTAPVFEPLLAPSRYKGAFGGRGGAKSHFFADLLIERCVMRRGTRAVCVREYQVSLHHSVKQLLEDKVTQYGLLADFHVTNTHIETPGDGVLLFKGMQSYNADSIKSLEGYDVAWVEEAQNLSQRSLDLLRPTMFRRPDSEIWCSWNPRFSSDPVDDFFRGNRPRKQGEPPWAPPKDSLLVRSSYRDNPWALSTMLREVEWDQARDPEKYAHVWLGEYERHSEARVFKNWRVEEFEAPADATFYYGGDWGFSVDPSVLVRCSVNGRKLFIDHEAYRIGVEIDHLPQLFDTVPGARDWPIVADSARPETISYLQRHGFPKMTSATKGPNSVKEGVIFLQNYDIIVHPRCVHTIDELTMYAFKVDPLTSMITPVLEDKKNHVIDSIRYATERLRAPKGHLRLTW
ncbi:MAG: PBSX family phage terminase large subunit [Candidatus Binataceae bacterium]